MALEDPGRSQGLVPRPQHLPPPCPYNFYPSPFPMWKLAKINTHILTAALWAGSDPSSPKGSTSTVPSPSLGHLAAAGSCHLYQPRLGDTYSQDGDLKVSTTEPVLSSPAKTYQPWPCCCRDSAEHVLPS